MKKISERRWQRYTFKDYTDTRIEAELMRLEGEGYTIVNVSDYTITEHLFTVIHCWREQKKPIV